MLRLNTLCMCFQLFYPYILLRCEGTFVMFNTFLIRESDLSSNIYFVKANCQIKSG